MLFPTDGTVNPGSAALALAKAAVDRGVRYVPDTTVTGFRRGPDGRRVTGIDTADDGGLDAEVVVLAGGLWTSELARLAGASVALYPAEHVWVMTDETPAATDDLPFLRDLDGYLYVRHYRGRFVIGAFEPNGKPMAPGERPDRRLRRARAGLGPLRPGARGGPRGACPPSSRSASRTTCGRRRASRPTPTSSSASCRRCQGCSSRLA